MARIIKTNTVGGDLVGVLVWEFNKGRVARRFSRLTLDGTPSYTLYIQGKLV